MGAEGLRLCKNGRLIKTEWNPDKEDYESSDVTDQAIRLLFEACELADDVTLKDIFLLLNTELQIFDSIFGNWCEEIVTYGLQNKGKVHTGEYDPDAIEYLELYQTWGTEKFKGEPPSFYGNIFPQFHGIGFVLKEDDKQGWPKKGERTPWSICLSDILDLVNLPVKLNTEIEIYEDDYTADPRQGYKSLLKITGVSYGLGQILFGILWELSFHGSPADSKKVSESLKEMVKEIKEKEGLTKDSDSGTIGDNNGQD